MLEGRGCLSQKQARYSLIILPCYLIDFIKIEDMAMINAKEAEKYVYSMFIDGILTLEVKTLEKQILIDMNSLIITIVYHFKQKQTLI